jgi:hypothetical protein
MIPEEIRQMRDALAGGPSQVHWCDDDDLSGENMAGVDPGGDLNTFGWYVIGTTGGGNAIVVRADDPAVFYAGHEWYGGDTFSFEDFATARLESRTVKKWDGTECVIERLRPEWVSVPFTAEGIRRSLFQLAPSIDEFRARVDEMGALLDKID